MISKTAIASLQLTHHTIRSCRDLYEELAGTPHLSKTMNLVLSRYASDPEALNKLWWVLNYHGENMDKNRRFRARVETRLEELANENKRRHPVQA